MSPVSRTPRAELVRVDAELVALMHELFCTPKHAYRCLNVDGAVGSSTGVPWTAFLNAWYDKSVIPPYAKRITRHFNLWRTSFLKQGADVRSLRLPAQLVPSDAEIDDATAEAQEDAPLAQ